jgi:hypothetical protein
MFKFYVKITQLTPQLIPLVSAGSWTVWWWSLWMSLDVVFSTFSIILLMPGCPEHSSSSTDNQLWSMNTIQNPLSQHKKCSPKTSQSISKVSGSRGTVSQTKFDAWDCHPCRQKYIRSRKCTLVKTMWPRSMVSRGSLMQVFESVALTSLFLFHQGSHINNSLGTSGTTLYSH